MRFPLALLCALAALPAAAQDEPASGALQSFTVNQAQDGIEPPLTENEPVYFVMGTRGGTNARFQLSFKYRLFDRSLGWGRDQPWLSGFYLGYTQTTIWNLQGDSKPFRDTSYRPSLFWAWERTDDKTWIDALRAGFEHESNGKDDAQSRSIDILFVRPEWRWQLDNGKQVAFTPKIYGYLDKEENPDIQRYRGYVDWRVRYDSGTHWVAAATARLGTAGKGSLQIDLSRRTRDLKLGPLSGYLYAQYFNGYGEDILGYNERRPSQLRLGVAIVP
ncbi:MAG: phospholipase A [Dongiaceae bacterium]